MHHTIRRRGASCGILLAATAATMPASAIQFGQIDTFSDGTTMNWIEGSPSPNPPVNAPSGGPGGAGDKYLRDDSSGGGGAGSRQVFFSDSQWTGNYAAAHVTVIEGQMANFSATSTLYMRVALEGTSGTAVSTNAILIPADGGVWHPVQFNLTSAGLTLLGGESVQAVLSNIVRTRILSSQLGSSINGDAIESTIGMDNLRARTIFGDANLDNTVNSGDFTLLAASFNQTNKCWSDGDFNFDGTVNALDFNALAANFGRAISLDAPAVGANVPEPTSLCTVAAIIAGMTSRRVRYR